MRQIAEHSLDALRTAEAGSDLQLVWARTLISVARSDEHLAIVRGLLDGNVPFEGLRIDTDLRWLIVGALASEGVVGEDVIAAECEIDPTDAGQRYAATARASRPLVEAKAEAWTRIVEDPATPLATIRALLAGFTKPDQADLLTPYRQPYFDQIQPTWESRPVEVAVTFVGGMYPGALASEELLAATDRYLDEHATAAPPIRRYLAEGTGQRRAHPSVSRARHRGWETRLAPRGNTLPLAHVSSIEDLGYAYSRLTNPCERKFRWEPTLWPSPTQTSSPASSSRTSPC